MPVRKDLADELERQLGQGHIVRPQQGRRIGVERDSLIRVIDWLIERAEARDLAGNAAAGLRSIADGDPWKSALPIFTQVNQGRAVSGYTKLKPLESFHTPSSRVDYRDEIYRELVRGRIVIVDLHLGPDATIRQLSENLAGHLMERQTEAFTSGNEPPLIQVALEEAHNLFSSERYKDDLDVWVRMAKQASKLKIGMLYATQEVTGVDHQVLANTKNWVVAHLNNSREVNELARFYDFKAFGDAIISHEDKGYVRLENHVLARTSSPCTSTGTGSSSSTRPARPRNCRRWPGPGAEAPDMPYDTITGGLEQASRLGHSEAAIRTLAERASFYVPAEHLRDLAWLRPKIRPKAGLPRPEGADRLTGVIGVDGSMMPVRVRDGLPSVHYGYAQAAAVWLDIEAMESQRAERFVDPVVLHNAVTSALVSLDLPLSGAYLREGISIQDSWRERVDSLFRTKKVEVNRLNQSLLRLLLLVHGGPGRPAMTVPVNCPAAGAAAPGSGRRRRDELSRLRGAPVPGRHAPHLRGGDGGRVQPGRPGQADAGDRAAGAGRPNDLALGAVPARCAPVDSVHHGRAARDVRAAGQAARPRRHLLPADDRDHARRRSLPVRRRENRDGRRLRVRAGPARRAPSR